MENVTTSRETRGFEARDVGVGDVIPGIGMIVRQVDRDLTHNEVVIYGHASTLLVVPPDHVLSIIRYEETT